MTSAPQTEYFRPPHIIMCDASYPKQAAHYPPHQFFRRQAFCKPGRLGTKDKRKTSNCYHALLILANSSPFQKHRFWRMLNPTNAINGECYFFFPGEARAVGFLNHLRSNTNGVCRRGWSPSLVEISYAFSHHRHLLKLRHPSRIQAMAECGSPSSWSGEVPNMRNKGAEVPNHKVLCISLSYMKCISPYIDQALHIPCTKSRATRTHANAYPCFQDKPSTEPAWVGLFLF